MDGLRNSYDKLAEMVDDRNRLDSGYLFATGSWKLSKELEGYMSCCGSHTQGNIGISVLDKQERYQMLGVTTEIGDKIRAIPEAILTGPSPPPRLRK